MKRLFLFLLAFCACGLLYSQVKEPDVSRGRLRTVRSNDSNIGRNSAYGESAGGELRVALDVGYSLRLGRFQDEISKATLNRNGFVYGADIHYFDKSDFGIGAKFTGRNYSDFIDVNTLFIGPSVMTRKMARNKSGIWVESFYAGYISYKEKIDMGILNASYSKGGFGLGSDLGYDIPIGSNVFWGLKLSVLFGFINFDDIPGADARTSTLSALEISTGIRF